MNRLEEVYLVAKKALLANDMDMNKAKEYLKEYDEIRMITRR